MAVTAATPSVRGRVQGRMMGAPGMMPWSLAAATIDPENVMEPMTAPRTTKIAVEIALGSVDSATHDAEVVTDRDQRGRAAADRVEQRHQLGHRGHLHGRGRGRGRCRHR